jgi:hypothetical protein
MTGYEIAAQIGAGGHGIVQSARQSSLGREVAIKHLKKPKDPHAVNALKAEAAAHGRLDHPHIVPVHDLVEAEGHGPCLIMKLVKGRAWAETLRLADGGERPPLEGPALEHEVRRQLVVCDAVASAHQRGLIHCDLKPSNVMIGDFGDVLVMDWGLAVEFSDEPDPSSPVPHRTVRNHASGTFAYMAPELATGQGHLIGPTTDTYLLGGILFEILAGRPPRTCEDKVILEDLAQRGHVDALPAGIPQGLARICQRALHSDQGQRFPTALALRAALDGWLGSQVGESLLVQATAASGPSASYADRQRALALVDEAGRQIPTDDPRPRALQVTITSDFAAAALANGDLELAASLVQDADPAFAGLRAQITAAQVERDRRQRRVRRLRRVALALLGLIVVVSVTAAVWISQARRQTESALMTARTSLARSEASRAFLRDTLLHVRPDVLGSEATVGQMLVAAKDQALADTQQDQAVRGEVLWALAELMLAYDRLQEALDLTEAATSALATSAPPVELAALLALKGTILFHLGRDQTAQDHLHRAEAQQAALLGPEHPATLRTLVTRRMAEGLAQSTASADLVAALSANQHAVDRVLGPASAAAGELLALRIAVANKLQPSDLPALTAEAATRQVADDWQRGLLAVQRLQLLAADRSRPLELGPEPDAWVQQSRARYGDLHAKTALARLRRSELLLVAIQRQLDGGSLAQAIVLGEQAADDVLALQRGASAWATDRAHGNLAQATAHLTQQTGAVLWRVILSIPPETTITAVMPRLWPKAVAVWLAQRPLASEPDQIDHQITQVLEALMDQGSWNEAASGATLILDSTPSAPPSVLRATAALAGGIAGLKRGDPDAGLPRLVEARAIHAACAQDPAQLQAFDGFLLEAVAATTPQRARLDPTSACALVQILAGLQPAIARRWLAPTQALALDPAQRQRLDAVAQRLTARTGSGP